MSLKPLVLLCYFTCHLALANSMWNSVSAQEPFSWLYPRHPPWEHIDTFLSLQWTKNKNPTKYTKRQSTKFTPSTHGEGGRVRCAFETISQLLNVEPLLQDLSPHAAVNWANYLQYCVWELSQLPLRMCGSVPNVLRQRFYEEYYNKQHLIRHSITNATSSWDRFIQGGGSRLIICAAWA